MRIAILSDIHGNLTAFEAVLGDLHRQCPDLVLHGGDLADAGANPAAVVDRIRGLGWQGVMGNTDEMLFRPEALEEFSSQSSAPPSLWKVIREMAAWTRSILGEERVAWLRRWPRVQVHAPIALVHASPESLWAAPTPEAPDAELQSIYGPLDQPVVVYGHIHRPYVRSLSTPKGLKIIANTGSVGLPYDGDRRASYLLLDGLNPTIRRVQYDVENELKSLSACGLPHTGWIARTLSTGRPQSP
jgi:predicted phosphodiesterase